MSDLSVDIIKLLSVILSREKQLLIEPDFRIYANAANFAIKSILKKRIPNKSKAEDLLFDDIANRFVFRTIDSSENITPLEYARRFNYSIVTEYVPQRVKAATTEHGLREVDRTPDEVREEFAAFFARQFVKDVLKTAASEIGKHRKLAKMLISARDKIPFFKPGTMILSGLFIKVDERTIELLTLSGEKVPIPFDKRSRNREIEILQELVQGKRKCQRVRLTQNKEGFLNIDLRIGR